MSRDDGGLYSGASSASFGITEAQEARAQANKKRLEQKEAKRGVLKPAAELIQVEFQKEITKLIYGPYPDEDTMSDAQFRTERKARKLAVASLLAIQARMNNVLRESPNEARARRTDRTDQARD